MSAQPLRVRRADFRRALREFAPAHTRREEDVTREFLPRGYVRCGKAHDQVRDAHTHTHTHTHTRARARVNCRSKAVQIRTSKTKRH